MSSKASKSGTRTRQPSTPAFDTGRFSQGVIDIPTEVDRGVELLRMAGRIDDEVAVRETFTADLEALSKTGVAMRITLDIPGENLPWDQLVALMDSKRPSGVKEADQWEELWAPYMNPESLTAAQLNGTATRIALRGLLLNADAERTDIDAALHHLGLPADEYARVRWNPDKPTTQEAEVAKDVTAFAAAFPELQLRAGNHRDYAFGVLSDRSRALPREQLLTRGWMYAIGLGRRAVIDTSVVPNMYLAGGRACFAGNSGDAHQYAGVGLSAGRTA